MLISSGCGFQVPHNAGGRFDGRVYGPGKGSAFENAMELVLLLRPTCTLTWRADTHTHRTHTQVLLLGPTGGGVPGGVTLQTKARLPRISPASPPHHPCITPVPHRRRDAADQGPS